jgi:hypothetical protein
LLTLKLYYDVLERSILTGTIHHNLVSSSHMEFKIYETFGACFIIIFLFDFFVRRDTGDVVRTVIMAVYISTVNGLPIHNSRERLCGQHSGVRCDRIAFENRNQNDSTDQSFIFVCKYAHVCVQIPRACNGTGWP